MPRKNSYKLDRVAIRMVKEPPLYSEEPLSNPETAIKVLRDVFKEYDREVVCVVNLVHAHMVAEHQLLAYVGKISDKSVNRIIRRMQDVLAEFCEISAG